MAAAVASVISAAARARATDFLAFNRASPEPFHAVEECKRRLKAAGFTHLRESEDWKLAPLGRYYYTRNESTLFAFVVGGAYRPGNGFNVVGAHTDSPCLKLKPNSRAGKFGWLQLGVQLYGGGLWYTWFDRDLALAGRVIVRKGDAYEHRLVRIDRPLLRVPTLAIHLDRTQNEDLKLNAQNHVAPVLATEVKRALGGAGDQDAAAPNTHHHPALLSLLSRELGCTPDEISDFELSLYDHAPGVLGGLYEEFVFAGRLDNLCSSYCALVALIESVENEAQLKAEENVSVIALYDNEEVGSSSAYGAASPMLNALMARVSKSCPGASAAGAAPLLNIDEVALSKSFLISADMAHGVHPNYGDKHEEAHRPAFHKGPVIKVNANQRYATTAQTSFLLKELGRLSSVPLQEFVVRNDAPCGSTIGPIISAGTGMRTVDIGAPQLSMHSIREMCGTDDIDYTVRLLAAFFASFTALDKKLRVE